MAIDQLVSAAEVRNHDIIFLTRTHLLPSQPPFLRTHNTTQSHTYTLFSLAHILTHLTHSHSRARTHTQTHTCTLNSLALTKEKRAGALYTLSLMAAQRCKRGIAATRIDHVFGWTGLGGVEGEGCNLSAQHSATTRLLDCREYACMRADLTVFVPLTNVRWRRCLQEFMRSEHSHDAKFPSVKDTVQRLRLQRCYLVQVGCRVHDTRNVWHQPRLLRPRSQSVIVPRANTRWM